MKITLQIKSPDGDLSLASQDEATGDIERAIREAVGRYFLNRHPGGDLNITVRPLAAAERPAAVTDRPSRCARHKGWLPR